MDDPRKDRYDHQKIEAKWQKVWATTSLDVADVKSAKKPFYNLMMFPYASAEGLHIGNMYAFTGSDIYGRFKRMQGYSVFEPIGLDGFGIHSENFALKIGRHPMDHAKITEKHFYDQLHRMGAMFDFTRTLETYDPSYYRWTQWLFVQMFKAGLAYRAKAEVNFCPSCKTVLADEQVVDGKCERCGNEVKKRALEQWFFRITAYAEKLLADIPGLKWSEIVKVAQTNWIGKKEGISITYPVVTEDGKQIGEVSCFTTRPDTNFGATFVVLAPEHEFVAKILSRFPPTRIAHSFSEEILAYITLSKQKSDQERIAEGKKKTGVFTGFYCINQLNNTKMPLYISDFVLSGFGTGVVVGVPGHDKRDFQFAQAFDLPVKRVVVKHEATLRSYLMGATAITDEDLKRIKVTIVEKDKENRCLEIPRTSIEAYKELIRNKLTPGYWNEVVGDDVWFCFKGKDKKISEYILTEQNKEEIARLCSSFNQDPIEKTSNIWLYLASNSWYEPYLIQENEGIMVNSGFLDSMDSHEASVKMMDYLEGKGWGKRVVTYHLRDWLISRQRYWGPPIPMIYCKACAKEGKSWFTQYSVIPDDAVRRRAGIHNHDSDADGIPHQVRDDNNNDRNAAGWPASNAERSSAGWYPVPEDQLPVLLPRIEDYKPSSDGVAPLSKHKEFFDTVCPDCGRHAVRETDVSDTFLDSSWYFLRYPSTRCARSGQVPFEESLTKKWLPVDMYTGGAEHSVLHLLYSRFVWMCLYDWGYFDFSAKGRPASGWDEPFTNFFAHGLIIKDGAKMSKSKGNIVNPDEYIAKYGADAVRLYLMFIGPFSAGGDFRDTGMEGMSKWVGRVWRVIQRSVIARTPTYVGGRSDLYNRDCFVPQSGTRNDNRETSLKVKRLLEKTIAKLTDDMEKRRYNTAIAALMELTNAIVDEGGTLGEDELKKYIFLLAPFTPHMSEEAWSRLNRRETYTDPHDSVHCQPWPSYDPKLLKDEKTTIIVQINGKTRGTIIISPKDAKNQKVVETKVRGEEKFAKHFTGSVKKTIFVPGRIINFVMG